MKTHLATWGNSLAVRIPKKLAEELSLQQGVEVDLRVHEGHLVIAPVTRPRYELEDLVRGITPDNRHAEVDWGPPVAW
ncbi:MAG: AbrB/MazE/SpoVT family DNA-binding domain-containing protein [Armatimonadetes bacterium]|nr:AbrB/MazE/SpoVT family DNA-binding domain-containing protein [Armatimonadota bacterium]